MPVCSKAIFIVGAKRTPFCKYGGSLRELPASIAFAAAAKNAFTSANLDSQVVDATVIGNVHFLSQCDGGKTPRYCGTYSGVPLDKPALGVNVACGTGLQAVITGAIDMLTKLSDVTLTGGTEIMSSLPFVVRRARFGLPLGTSYGFEDFISSRTLDESGTTAQKAAEELAKRCGVTRREADEFTLQSHLRYQSAKKSGSLKNEMAALSAPLKKQQVDVTEDELEWVAESMEDLERLSAAEETGSVVTASNSASPGDGAAALILATDSAVRNHGLTPLARVVGWARCGGHIPTAAAEAQRILLGDRKAELVEVNETFAAEAVAVCRSLDVDPTTVNQRGGALVYGHPVAASGARMLVQLVHQMESSTCKTALAISSCGFGQTIAVLLEKP